MLRNLWNEKKVGIPNTVLVVYGSNNLWDWDPMHCIVQNCAIKKQIKQLNNKKSYNCCTILNCTILMQYLKSQS